jgi:5-(carboxyamino)imidazole ribonucleotide synthase
VSRVGVLGGGQLGLMMAEAGAALGQTFTFLDPAPDACAGTRGGLITAAFDDEAGLDRLAAASDLVTWDFENVPEASAERIAARVPVHPPPAALGACQDRLSEKRLFRGLGLEVAPFHAVSSRIDLAEGVERLGLPAVLKTRRFGYDGKGQAVLRDREDLERAWQRLGDHPLILESFVPFERECSIILARGADGAHRHWPLVRNHHRGGILAFSLAPDPAASGTALEARAASMARRVAEHLGYVGVLVLELFVTRDGALLVNEMAPRVHNSGHWTIEGAETSQFENHLRAVAGLPLGETATPGCALMFNWIGAVPDASASALDGVHWHDYGKKPRPGRKVGHATVTAPDLETLATRARALARAVGGDAPGELEDVLRGAVG